MDTLVETLERATLDAVAPATLEEIAGWLLPMDASSIGRATSAVPLRHSDVPVSDLPAIEARYAGTGHRPRFRIADSPGLAAVHRALGQRGYTAGKPTLTRLISVEALAEIAPLHQVTITDQPSASWASVYVSEGFDPVDGQERTAALSRGRHTLYAVVQTESGAVAAGTASLSQGWMGIHGMRTLPSARAQGFASQIMRALAQRATELGLVRSFLQVEEDNEGANRLYNRLGFETAWRYQYWERDHTP